MMVRKIDIRNYTVEIMTPEGVKVVPYGVVVSIENIALASSPGTSQKLTMPQALEMARIIEKIKAQEKEGKKFILLEDADFNKIKASFDAFSGFGKNEVELLKRIAGAEEVKVKEVKGKKE